jgi:hypothetical protein
MAYHVFRPQPRQRAGVDRLCERILVLKRELARTDLEDDLRAIYNNRLADTERAAANMTLGEK